MHATYGRERQSQHLILGYLCGLFPEELPRHIGCDGVYGCGHEDEGPLVQLAAAGGYVFQHHAVQLERET
jgi:hypothetical protein